MHKASIQTKPKPHHQTKPKKKSPLESPLKLPMNKIIFLFLQLRYNAILYLESHCSTIADFFTVVYIYNSGCNGVVGLLY